MNRMRIQEISTFDELLAYLRDFANFGGGPVPYDFLGTYLLFEALLTNLSERSIDQDVLDLAESYRLDERQRKFLKRLLEVLPSEED